jgi:hypothetical protein
MRGIRAIIAFVGDSRAHFCERGATGCFIRHDGDRNQPHGCVAMTGVNDLITGFGAAHQFGKLTFCISHGYLHG